MASNLKYKRVLLKLSGEALAGEQGYGIDAGVAAQFAAEIAAAVALDVRVGVVIGGGNFGRGVDIAKGANRVAADQMFILGTIINSIALNEALHQANVDSRIFSAVPMPTICETFSQQRARKAFDEGRVLVFAGGTGHPFFSTDSGAALRAAEMDCDGLFKGTNVDGIYSADPKRDKTATRYERLTHAEVLARGLQVMDATAVALARDNHIPVIVFSIHQPGAFVSVLKGTGRATVVSDA